MHFASSTLVVCYLTQFQTPAATQIFPDSKFYLDMHDSFICPLFLYGFFIVFDASKNALDMKPIMNGLRGAFLLTISVEEIYVRSTLRRLDLNIWKRIRHITWFISKHFRPITETVSLQKFLCFESVTERSAWIFIYPMHVIKLFFFKKSNSMNSFCQQKNLEHEEINLIYYPYFVPLWCFWWKISRNVFCIKPPFEKIWHKLRKECVKRRPPFKSHFFKSL